MAEGIAPIQYGIVTSNRSAVTSPPISAGPFAGRFCVYRLGFAAMEIPGLPADLVVGGVHIRQSKEPVSTQRTAVIQRPGLRVVYEKHMDRATVIVGDHLVLTIGELYTTVPSTLHLDRAMSLWQDRVLSSLAAVATVLDDRIAHTPLLEDVLIDQGADQHAVVDRAVNLREYASANKLGAEEKESLRCLTPEALPIASPATAAARWYLRGAQAGPTADGAVFMFIALEALVPLPPGKKNKSFDVKAVEAAISRAGGAPATLDPSVGRLAGLRADLVHHGKEDPPLLYEGYYALEWTTRLLLRYELGVDHAKAWPLNVHESSGSGITRAVAEVARQLPKQTIWTNPRKPEPS